MSLEYVHYLLNGLKDMNLQEQAWREGEFERKNLVSFGLQGAAEI